MVIRRSSGLAWASAFLAALVVACLPAPALAVPEPTSLNSTQNSVSVRSSADGVEVPISTIEGEWRATTPRLDLSGFNVAGVTTTVIAKTILAPGDLDAKGRVCLTHRYEVESIEHPFVGHARQQLVPFGKRPMVTTLEEYTTYDTVENRAQGLHSIVTTWAPMRIPWPDRSRPVEYRIRVDLAEAITDYVDSFRVKNGVCPER